MRATFSAYSPFVGRNCESARRTWDMRERYRLRAARAAGTERVSVGAPAAIAALYYRLTFVGDPIASLSAGSASRPPRRLTTARNVTLPIAASSCVNV